MNLTALPAFADNCISLIDDDAAAIVDPGKPGPLAEALDARRLEWRRF
jgi:glyoxylase-like metal-dependent hydrolase (beta-lactamase superfamily II)